MRYVLLFHWPEPEPGELDQEQLAAGQEAFRAYAEALEEAGVLVSADVLQPSTAARTVSARNGSIGIHDGPFAETKEQIGGVFVIDVPDDEAAMAWAERCPSVYWGTVEVRPSAVHVVDGAWVGAA